MEDLEALRAVQRKEVTPIACVSPRTPQNTCHPAGDSRRPGAKSMPRNNRAAVWGWHHPLSLSSQTMEMPQWRPKL